nr:hypothetical protein BaRGS_022004 [Batillaria attramentaria]
MVSGKKWPLMRMTQKTRVRMAQRKMELERREGHRGLEREDQDFFPEDDRREYHDDEMEDDRESTNGRPPEISMDQCPKTFTLTKIRGWSVLKEIPVATTPSLLSSASAGPVLPSRTSSQGSIHSTTSNNSNSRVSGVGKESNSNRNPQRVSKTQPAKPSDQFPADAVVTQVGQLHQESQRQERDGRGNMSVEVQGMEEVRSRLQSMLRVPRDAAAFDSRAFDFADSASDLLMDRPPHHLRDDASSVSGYRGQEEMSDMFETFPSFSYKVYSDMSSMSMKSDMSSHSEVVYLRDCLEKERYRRKHCEQQIQALNGKLLETQQQLAVAVSTDKRKDIMIDQLDKQLAKVVEGWKKREADKDEYMHMVMKEKSQIEETLHKQQAMIDSFERDLANTVEELKQEKESSAAVVDKLKAELSAAVHDKEHSEDMLQAERERATLMEQEWEQLKESRDLAEKRAQQAQERLHSEQDNWYEREQELLHKIDQVKDANLKVMQMERVKLEEQTKKGEELEEKLHQAETEVKRLEMEVDSAVREKESLKVEMAITEAKFESAQRSLEADMHAQMEREISEQLNDVHEKMRAEQEEQAEKHRRMVSELHQRHQKDMEKQMSALRQETHRKEEDHRQQIAELESRLNEYRQENTTLKQAKQKLESQSTTPAQGKFVSLVFCFFSTRQQDGKGMVQESAGRNNLSAQAMQISTEFLRLQQLRDRQVAAPKLPEELDQGQ